MALLWSLIAWSAWSQQSAVLAGTTVKGAAQAAARLIGEGSASHFGVSYDDAALTSSRLVEVVSDSHFGGGHDRRERWSGLFSVGRLGLSQPL